MLSIFGSVFNILAVFFLFMSLISSLIHYMNHFV